MTTREQIENTQAAYEAGAALVHFRNAFLRPDRFAVLRRAFAGTAPTSSSNPQPATAARRSISTEPCCTLATGSVDFPTIVHENPPDFVRALARAMRDGGTKPGTEVFDLAMPRNTVDLVKEGLIAPPHVHSVFGVKHRLSARRDILEFEVAKLEEVLPGVTWTAAGVGRHQFEGARWTLELGRHCRAGRQDSIRLDRNTPAPSNAAPVERVATTAAEHGRLVATAKQARELPDLGMLV